MPTFYPQTWGDYTVHTKNSNILREIMRFYSFGTNTEIILYYYSTWIDYKLLVIRNKRKVDNKLDYEWSVWRSVENEITDKIGKGEINISNRTTRNTKKNAIRIGRISVPGQYKVRLKLSNGIAPPSPLLDIAEFTIKDKDEASVQLFWILVSALIGAFVSGLFISILGN